jgi:hypothetical protein
VSLFWRDTSNPHDYARCLAYRTDRQGD